jgi:hypothetical protein
MAIGFAASGDHGEALALAGSITGAGRSSRLLVSIARAQAAAGNATVAKRTLRSAAKAAAMMKKAYRKEQAVERIAMLFVTLGDYRAAGRAAASVKKEWQQGDVAKAIANAQATAGDFGGAVKTARALRGWDRDKVLSRITGSQIGDGRLAEARATVASIETSWLRNAGVVLVARAEALAGRYEDARQTVAQIAAAPNVAAEALADLAVIALTADRPRALTLLAEARRLLTEPGGPPHAAASLASIARAEMLAGRADEAVATLAEGLAAASTIDDSAKRSRAIGAVAVCAHDVPGAAGAIQRAFDKNKSAHPEALIDGAVESGPPPVDLLLRLALTCAFSTDDAVSWCGAVATARPDLFLPLAELASSPPAHEPRRDDRKH